MYKEVTKTVASANICSAVGRETTKKSRVSLKNVGVGINFTLFVMLAFVLSTFVFTGCDKDDDDSVGNTNNKASELFVGKWQGEYTGAAGIIWIYNWDFKADGSYTESHRRKDGFGSTGGGDGTWVYESQSKTLVTTASQNWEIVVLTKDLWTGKNSYSGTMATFTRIQ
jgi:hypothetical protein